VGIPADLLRRRPDIRRSAREVAAQSARIGVAEADLYPRLAVNGFIGYAASDLSDVFNQKSFLGFVIPTLQWNVLNYGRVTNNVRIQDARLQAAEFQYQQTVLNAGREVEDALVGFLQAQQQAARLAESVAEAERFVELVVLQFEEGVTDFNRVFNAQSTLVTLQDQLASARGNIALNMIQAYKALGGGWQCFVCGNGIPDPRVVEARRAAAAEEVPAATPPARE
jgi:outer membrane protein TolC